MTVAELTASVRYNLLQTTVCYLLVDLVARIGFGPPFAFVRPARIGRHRQKVGERENRYSFGGGILGSFRKANLIAAIEIGFYC